jgi:pimeloyl-ACP methyl ester carboxylesterase
MNVTSADGTTIAFDRSGTGPVLILVGGTFEQRAMDSETSQLAALPLLARHFTVVHYDRRGRGQSTDTLSYAVEREVEDIEALVDDSGGSAFLSGISSGAALAFEAALGLGEKVTGLAMYEPPYNDDDAARQAWRAFREQLSETLADDRPGDAVGLFMKLLGAPAEDLERMRQFPIWPMWEAIAPTIAYDAEVLGADGSVPTKRAARLGVPALIMTGGTSYPFMQATATALAQAIPNARHQTLEGQSHEVAAEALGPVLVEFLLDVSAKRGHARDG